MRNRKTLLTTVIAAAVFSAGVATPAFADTSGDTEVTVTLPVVATGTLSIAKSAPITMGTNGQGSNGKDYAGATEHVVTDTRKPVSNWAMQTRISSDFKKDASTTISADQFKLDSYGNGGGVQAAGFFDGVGKMQLSNGFQEVGKLRSRTGDSVMTVGLRVNLLKSIGDGYSGTFKGVMTTQVL